MDDILTDESMDVKMLEIAMDFCKTKMRHHDSMRRVAIITKTHDPELQKNQIQFHKDQYIKYKIQLEEYMLQH